MTEETKREIERLQSDIEELSGHIHGHFDGIQRCMERLSRFVDLSAPQCCIDNEVRMIQYRALNIQSNYEAITLIKESRILNEQDPQKPTNN